MSTSTRHRMMQWCNAIAHVATHVLAHRCDADHDIRHPATGSSFLCGVSSFLARCNARSTRSPRSSFTCAPRRHAPRSAPPSRRAEASDQARRHARLRASLRVLRSAARLRRRHARPRASAREGRSARAGQRRRGMPAVQPPQGGHAARRVLHALSLGGEQLHPSRPCRASSAQASGSSRGESRLRRGTGRRLTLRRDDAESAPVRRLAGSRRHHFHTVMRQNISSGDQVGSRSSATPARCASATSSTFPGRPRPTRRERSSAWATWARKRVRRWRTFGARSSRLARGSRTSSARASTSPTSAAGKPSAGCTASSSPPFAHHVDGGGAQPHRSRHARGDRGRGDLCRMKSRLDGQETPSSMSS